jgi:type III restriction enzyme
MDRIANQINNRLSLRPPQTRSLEILSDLINGEENILQSSTLEEKLKLVNEKFRICIDFERDFPSICFALATGVGKTRLMGAFVTYLYLAKGIKHFFVLAPNLTIYQKLMDDFQNPQSPKYVFKGIGEFATEPPRIITGDNYNEISQSSLFQSDVHINIFNISKINAETRQDREPRIKRLSEYLGDSYFNYLSNLDDLVLLMDESHHYRADRGMQVINELQPLLGLELTATPQVERAGTPVKFRNVVYEYSLAHAIQDGFVKEPCVATRRDFNPAAYKVEELDRIKIEDGIRIHEDTKVALDIYARETGAKQVKPFVLIVAKETDHAAEIKKLIQQNTFFDGRYADKVIEIHSNQRGEEKEENIQQLLSVEDPDNRTEIVIHVNMLKEGWDVTNLYTIVPLRTAASLTLREQTIGRGLRLPYGKRTGNPKVDKLTIVSHDKFQEIIEEANKPDSIIRKENIIEIDPVELSRSKEVISVKSALDNKYEAEKQEIAKIPDEKKREGATLTLEIKQNIIQDLPELAKLVRNVSEISGDEVKKIAIERFKSRIESNPQTQLFVADMVAEAESIYEKAVKDFSDNIIEIPRIIILQSGDIKHGFHDFDLDTKNLNFQPVSEEILRQSLKDNSQEIIQGKGRIISDTNENILVNELVNYPEVDYDSQSDLLFKMSSQAIGKFRTYLNDDDLYNVVLYNKREIGRFIFSQMMLNFYIEETKYQEPIVYPFERILDHNYSKYTQDKIHLYTDTITPTSLIPGLLFSGFSKAYHHSYKFDSKTEKDFSIILEQDKTVLKWLRPAKNQFRIYWKHNSKQYSPDFVVETADSIYLVETKKEGDIDATDVQEKAKAALEYCKHATDYTTVNGGKPWKYLLIPHSEVSLSCSFSFFAERFLEKR